jgi:hypothetical protein
LLQKDLAVLLLESCLCLDLEELALDIQLAVEVRQIYCAQQDKVSIPTDSGNETFDNSRNYTGKNLRT